MYFSLHEIGHIHDSSSFTIYYVRPPYSYIRMLFGASDTYCSALGLSYPGVPHTLAISRSIPQYAHPRPHILQIASCNCGPDVKCCNRGTVIQTNCFEPTAHMSNSNKRLINLNESVKPESCVRPSVYGNSAMFYPSHQNVPVCDPPRHKLDLFNSLEFESDSDSLDASSLLSSISRELLNPSSPSRRQVQITSDIGSSGEGPWSLPN